MTAQRGRKAPGRAGARKPRNAQAPSHSGAPEPRNAQAPNSSGAPVPRDFQAVVTRLRERWRGLLVVAGLALLVGVLVWSRGYSVELTSAEVLVDTPQSQAVDIGVQRRDETTAVPDFETLATRTRLLGSLMSSGRLEDAIAADAGIAPEDLTVVPPAPQVETSGPQAPPEEPAGPDSEAAILTLATDGELPILHVVAQAPEAALAEALSYSAVKALRRYVGSVAADDDIPAERQLVVRPIGGPRALTDQRGPGEGLALAAALMAFAAGCAALVLIPAEAFRGGLRAVSGAAGSRRAGENGARPPRSRASKPRRSGSRSGAVGADGSR